MEPTLKPGTRCECADLKCPACHVNPEHGWKYPCRGRDAVRMVTVRVAGDDDPNTVDGPLHVLKPMCSACADFAESKAVQS